MPRSHSGPLVKSQEVCSRLSMMMVKDSRCVLLDVGLEEVALCLVGLFMLEYSHVLMILVDGCFALLFNKNHTLAT